jgi:hypothetical protein
MLHDLTAFSSMARCGTVLRRSGEGAANMEAAASAIVEYLYSHFLDADSKRALALVRLFKTRAYGELESNLKGIASSLVAQTPPFETKCLTLMATIGDKPEWCSRHLSNGHQTIPLLSEEGVARIPMIAGLIRQLGISIADVLQPSPSLLADLSQRTFNVFHVPEALGSAIVPVQDGFVIPERIRSCVGFGGMLPDGNLFALIMFSRVSIPRRTALMLKPLSLSVKAALLPFIDDDALIATSTSRSEQA